MSATTRPGAALLDVNVLVALAWTNHVHHEAATSWFRTHGARGWATSPFTEAGFVRVSSNRSAMLTSTTPATARHGGRLATFDARIARFLDDAESQLVLTIRA